MNEHLPMPNMAGLLAFEATARHMSFTRAGEELGLTQSAVSRQVQGVEQVLGVPLLERVGKRLSLTAAGQAFVERLRPALTQIRDATLQAQVRGRGAHQVQLAVLPIFGTKLLLPTLPDFNRQHPEVEVHVHTRIGEHDQVALGFDVAVRVGQPHQWPDLQVTHLLDEHLVPVVSPRFKQRMPSIRRPEDLAQCTLLQVSSRPTAWAQWFDRYAPQAQPRLSGPWFELTTHALQALESDMGVALLPQALLANELRRGELAVACEGDVSLSTGRSYCLTAIPSSLQRPAVAALHGWIERLFVMPQRAV